jgi:hypothetical protein
MQSSEERGRLRSSEEQSGNSSRISLEANLKRVLKESWQDFAVFHYFEPMWSMSYASSTSLSVTTPSNL